MRYSIETKQTSNTPPANAQRLTERGYSIIELLIVIALIAVLTTFSVMALRPQQNAYKSDDQVLKILDYMREASQRALMQRQSMVVNINGSTNTIELIDENLVGNADNQVIRRESLARRTEIRFDDAPTGIVVPNPPNYTKAAYSTTTNIWTMRFRSNGTVGTGATNLTNATLFVWPVNPANNATTSNPQAVRAITIFGSTGTVRLWKYNGTAFVAR